VGSTSAPLNKPLRTLVVPILRDAGFQQVDARNGWSWRNDLIWVFNIRSVGSYFSGVTGWPPGSVCAWLGVFFTFAPRPGGMKVDDRGRMRPAEHSCHMRITSSATSISPADAAPVEFGRARANRHLVGAARRENVDEVASDIANALRDHGLPGMRGLGPRERLGWWRRGTTVS
jgi:hypothetical protein